MQAYPSTIDCHLNISPTHENTSHLPFNCQMSSQHSPNPREYKPLTLQRSTVVSTFPQPTRIQAIYPPTVDCHINISPTTRIKNSLSFLHSLPCLNLCFNRNLLPIHLSTPTFKLAIVLLLAGDVCLNHGSAIMRNIQLATTNVQSVRVKTASHMIQSHALPTFLLLVIPSIIDHVQLDEVLVLAFLYHNS